MESERLNTAPLVCRGVRGATTIENNTSEDILKGTRESLALMIRFNGIDPDDVASAIFTTTSDVNAAFPALAARQLQWSDVALMCEHELDVPGSLKKCIRILLHWNTTKTSSEIRHVYIKGAARLRPERADLPPVDWEELESWIQEQIDLEAK
jgi:chorismate mutase